MSELFYLGGALAAGGALGAFYFGGLRWTVERGLRVDQPALLFMASFLLRTAFACGAMYVVARAGLYNVALCLVGFLAVRTLLLRYPTQHSIAAVNGEQTGAP